MDNNKTQQIADQIMDLYSQFGSAEYAGEKVSQSEHMSQAAELALEEGYDEDVVLAAFLHDIGHLLPIHSKEESMNGFGTVDHEKVGADYLARLGFSDKLCSLIKSHVNAKRYLTFKYPDYYNQLSDASKQTLEYQGGRMDPEEALAFEQDTFFPLYIKMRGWDEAAKDTSKVTPLPNKFRGMMIRHLNMNWQMMERKQ